MRGIKLGPSGVKPGEGAGGGEVEKPFRFRGFDFRLAIGKVGRAICRHCGCSPATQCRAGLDHVPANYSNPKYSGYFACSALTRNSNSLKLRKDSRHGSFKK